MVSNYKEAYALQRAEKAGIATFVADKKDFPSQETFENAIICALDNAGIRLIVLAGFMSILSEKFTSRYADRILNVHPSLIPKFCGKGSMGSKFTKPYSRQVKKSRGLRCISSTKYPTAAK